MKKKHMSINLITYNAAITALSKGAKQRSRSQQRRPNQQPKVIVESKSNDRKQQELWKIAMDLLEEIKKDGLSPDRFTFSAVINCCGCEGRWREALDLIASMKKGGPKTHPNAIAYTAAISACGRSGEYEHALQLFRDMKDQGVHADQVAYNALFSALRRSGKTDIAYDLWCEMRGTKVTKTANGEMRKKLSKSKNIKNNKFSKTKFGNHVRPDIITITDVIAVLARSEKKIDYIERVDDVFNEAVELGLVLRGDSLDSTYEFDLSGMSFPVARAAVRFILKRLLLSPSSSSRKDKLPENLSFITGVGQGSEKKDTESQNDIASFEAGSVIKQ